MAEPSMELDGALTSAPTTYDIPFINGNTVDATKTLRWGADDSADGAITNVQRPSSGNKWADELWDDDSDGADGLICDSDEQPDAATQRAMMLKVTSDAVSYATAPRFTVFDSSSHTDTEEFIDGTTNHTSPFIKARGQTATTAPPQYWGEASDAALHILDNASAITCGDATGNQENCSLDGMNSYLVSSSTDISTNPQYLSLACSLPDDATTGVDAIDGVFTVRYTFT